MKAKIIDIAQEKDVSIQFCGLKEIRLILIAQNAKKH
jgi:hypothetical protein